MSMRSEDQDVKILLLKSIISKFRLSSTKRIPKLIKPLTLVSNILQRTCFKIDLNVYKICKQNQNFKHQNQLSQQSTHLISKHQIPNFKDRKQKQMQKQTNLLCKHFNDSLLTAFKNASQVLKQSASKSMYETHNKLMNKILLVSEKDLELTMREILSHLLNFAQVKNSTPTVIGLLTKFIQFLKSFEKVLSAKYQKNNNSLQKTNLQSTKEQQKTSIASKKNIHNDLSETINHHNPEQVISDLLTQIIDIILLIQNKTKSGDSETYLRIIQTIFSTIDTQFIQYMSFNLLTKIFSISFECCHVSVVIQNISVSCLFSLTQTLFSLEGKEKESHLIMESFLEHLFRNKKFSWIKDGDLNGLIWDLIVSGVRNQKQQSLQKFVEKQSNVQLLNLMYKISAEKAFSQKMNQQKQPPAKDSKKSNINEASMTFKHDSTSEFIRCYKAFIILSMQYSLLNLHSSPQKEQIVPFKDNIRLFNIIYELQRNWRMYILLEGVFLLIEKYPEFPVSEEKGYILMEIISKIAEQLCLCNHKIPCQWANEKSFLNKFYAGDLWTINDGDFLKIIRNSLISLRKKFEHMKSKEGQQWNQNKTLQLEKSLITQNANSQRSEQGQKSSQNQSTARKRWQKFIRCIIKIIRYLSSISILSQSDEQPVRKIILELQHWFLICPSSKIKNLILQQLLITTSTLTTKQQAIKISQCIQIGSNLIYGYYDMLDSIGLTIIMKMMAGIKASRQEGKQFQELEEVFNMSQKLYLQQRIVKTQKQFSTTIQAFVQCANSLLADLEQPTNLSRVPALGKHPSQRYYKMIEYILQKLNIVILQNKDNLFNEWNFLTGFWMSFCSNKNHEIQLKTIVYVGQVVQKLLEFFKQRQEEIISIYLQLSAKCTTKKDLKIEYQIISQIKNYIPLLENQQALMETFRVIKVLQSQVKTNNLQKPSSINLSEEKKFMLQLSELQEAFVKEGIHRINNLVNLAVIIEGIEVLGNEKNEEYKILTLLWTVADHLRTLSSSYEQASHEQNLAQQSKNQYQSLWKQIFQKIQSISIASTNVETKQCSIHTFTQIIAESSPVIKDNILRDLYEKVFIQSLFLELMQSCTRFDEHMKEVDMSLKVDLIKAATKNYLKLTKKFLLQKIFAQPAQIIQFTLEKILKYLESFSGQDSKQNLPVQVMYEYLVFIEKLINNQNVNSQWVNKQIIGKAFLHLDKIGQRIDQTTILWRKKYSPHLTQVKQIFNKWQVSQENQNQNGQLDEAIKNEQSQQQKL